MGNVWSEVLSEGLLATWAWDEEVGSLGVFITPIGGYQPSDADFDAIQRYAQDKEVDLAVNDMYDRSDYDGSVEEFVSEELSL